jgi:hypothetical protein
MSDEKYRDLKKIIYCEEIIKNLRKEMKELIEENDYLKNRVKDLEEINMSHQELVGELLKNRSVDYEKKKRGSN